MIRLVAVNALYSFKALFRWQTPEAYLIQKMLFPLVQLIFFALIGLYGAAQPLSFYLIGNCIAVSFRPMFAITTAIAEERSGGTLLYLIGTPANRVVLFFGRAVFNVIDGMIDMAVAFVVAIALFGLRLPAESWPGIFLSIFVASLAACGLGFFLGALAYVVLDAAFLGNLLLFVFLLLTGANVPLTEFPPAIRALSEALPITHTIVAARGYAAGAPLVDGLPLLAGDLVIGTVWALGGFALFSWVEYQARSRGTLEGF